MPGLVKNVSPSPKICTDYPKLPEKVVISELGMSRDLNKCIMVLKVAGKMRGQDLLQVALVFVLETGEGEEKRRTKNLDEKVD